MSETEDRLIKEQYELDQRVEYLEVTLQNLLELFRITTDGMQKSINEEREKRMKGGIN